MVNISFSTRDLLLKCQTIKGWACPLRPDEPYVYLFCSRSNVRWRDGCFFVLVWSSQADLDVTSRYLKKHSIGYRISGLSYRADISNFSTRRLFAASSKPVAISRTFSCHTNAWHILIRHGVMMRTLALFRHINTQQTFYHAALLSSFLGDSCLWYDK